MAHTHEFIRDERPGWQGGFYCRVPGCGLRIPGTAEQVARSAGARFVDETTMNDDRERDEYNKANFPEFNA